MMPWTCAACHATNETRWAFCEGCGAEHPVLDRRAPRIARAKFEKPAPVPSQYRVLTTTYPEPRPEDDAVVRAELAKVKALLNAPPTTGPGLIPPIAPEVRAEVARRAKLSDRVEPPDLAEMEEW